MWIPSIIIIVSSALVSVYTYSIPDSKCAPKKLLSFNTALEPSSAKYVDDRRSFLVPELRKLQSDVICLQEVYYGKDVKNTALHLMFSGYPYSYSSLHDERGRLKWGLIQTKPCNTDASVQTTLQCLNNVCKVNFNSEKDRLRCAVTQCKLLDLPDNCVSCVLVSGIDDVSNKCVNGTDATQINIPGLMILSKKPIITNKRAKYFPNARDIFSKEYLVANIYDLGEVICTQMTNKFSRLQTMSDLFFIEGEGMNLLETMKLLDDASVHDKKNVLLFGNLNSGPSIPSEAVESEAHNSYAQLMENNLRSPYAEMVGKPTVCHACNKLADDRSSVSDHILTRGYKIAEAKRVLDQNLPGKDYPLSSHYGVQVTLETDCEHQNYSAYP